MIAGYSKNGQVSDALGALSQMVEDGLRPNGPTFLSLLSACSHAGMIEQGRAGYVHEAKEIITSTSIEPDATIWRALLTACRFHADVELAKTIFEKLVEIEPSNAANYVALANVYAAAGQWAEVRNLRMQVREKCLGKEPGVSWIFLRNEVHCFTSGDCSHPMSGQIYAILQMLLASVDDNVSKTDSRWILCGGVDDLNIDGLL